MGMGILITIKCLLIWVEWKVSLEQFVEVFIIVLEILEFILKLMEVDNVISQIIIYFIAVCELVRLVLTVKKFCSKLIRRRVKSSSLDNVV